VAGVAVAVGNSVGVELGKVLVAVGGTGVHVLVAVFVARVMVCVGVAGTNVELDVGSLRVLVGVAVGGRGVLVLVWVKEIDVLVGAGSHGGVVALGAGAVSVLLREGVEVAVGLGVIDSVAVSVGVGVAVEVGVQLDVKVDVVTGRISVRVFVRTFVGDSVRVGLALGITIVGCTSLTVGVEVETSGTITPGRFGVGSRAAPDWTNSNMLEPSSKAMQNTTCSRAAILATRSVRRADSFSEANAKAACDCAIACLNRKVLIDREASESAAAARASRTLSVALWRKSPISVHSIRGSSPLV